MRLLVLLPLVFASCADGGLRECAIACGDNGVESASTDGCKCKQSARTTAPRTYSERFCDTCLSNCPGGLKTCSVDNSAWGPVQHCECFPPPAPTASPAVAR